MATEFTPLTSAFGGLLIGLAAVVLMAFNGRIAGATGILGGALFGPDRTWRIAMLAGMVAAPLLLATVFGVAFEISVPVSTPMLVIGGMLVGVGVTLGSGCTSGHGVCGLARFSARSLTATVTFMITTAATVFIIRHILGG